MTKYINYTKFIYINYTKFIYINYTKFIFIQKIYKLYKIICTKFHFVLSTNMKKH